MIIAKKASALTKGSQDAKKQEKIQFLTIDEMMRTGRDEMVRYSDLISEQIDRLVTEACQAGEFSVQVGQEQLPELVPSKELFRSWSLISKRIGWSGTFAVKVLQRLAVKHVEDLYRNAGGYNVSEIENGDLLLSWVPVSAEFCH